MDNKSSVILLLAVAGFFIIGGSMADHQNQINTEKKMQAFKVEPEFIKTRGLQAPQEFQHTIGSRHSSSMGYWVTAPTDDWMLLNGDRGTALCPHVLGPFGWANARDEALSAEAFSLVVAGFKDKVVELQVFVPRFDKMPEKLDSCVGFSYDSAERVLKVGDKKVAYLAPRQSRLVSTGDQLGSR